MLPFISSTPISPCYLILMFHHYSHIHQHNVILLPLRQGPLVADMDAVSMRRCRVCIGLIAQYIHVVLDLAWMM